MQVRIWEQLDAKKIEIMAKTFQDLGLEATVEGATYGGISELILTAKNGKSIRFTNSPYVHRQKPTTVEKWVLTGNVLGLPVNEQFNTCEEAMERKRTFDDSSLRTSDAVLSVDRKEIEIDEPQVKGTV